MSQVVLVLVLANLIVSYGKDCPGHHEAQLVTTPLGAILGSTMTTRLGRPIHAFRGIRYGQPPVGELRFKPPLPVGPWRNIYNATADGPLCPQPALDPMSEDCLFLNVYTPQLPTRPSRRKLPVVIFLHAGGFYAFTGRSNWIGPQYLLDQDIVLVTLNYRIGTLGFLSIGKESPGNNGLRDQVLAMKWVKHNIAAFGGDPNSVTLYGYSAGSWSIQLHMVSPMSRGLFHKAISSSGSALGAWPLPNTQIDLARTQAQLVGCNNTTTTKEIYNCLKKAPAEDLGRSLLQFWQFGSNPVLLWSPVIENDYGQERFLSDEPIKLIKNGNFMNVPVLIGITKDEFAYGAIEIVQNSTLLNTLSDDFDTYGPICFLYERDTPKSKKMSAKLRQFYLGDAPLTNSSLAGLEKLYYDSIEGFPITRAARLLSLKNSAPVYFYQFDYQGRFSFYYLPGTNNTQLYGVVHHDDLIYTFYNSFTFPFFQPSDPESLMVDKLTTLWTNFAKTGNPTPEVSKNLDNLRWLPYNIRTDRILHINSKLEFRDRDKLERYKVWTDLFPLSEYV